MEELTDIISISTFEGGREIPTVYGESLNENEIFIEVNQTSTLALKINNIDTFVREVKNADSNKRGKSIGQNLVYYFGSSDDIDEGFRERVIGRTCPNCNEVHNSHTNILVVGGEVYHHVCISDLIDRLKVVFENNANSILVNEFEE